MLTPTSSPLRPPSRAFQAARSLAIALGFAALLAGCGGASKPTTATGSRTITDAKGQRISVPSAPRRVIALSEPTLDGALALGLRPIATTGGRGQGSLPGYLGRRGKGIESVGVLGQPDLEKVATLRPDLILTDGTSIQDGAVLDKLRRIAPTAYVSRTGEDWRTALTSLAQTVNRVPAGTQALASFDRRVASIRGRLGANADATVSLVRWNGIGLPAVLMREPPAGRVLTALGLERPRSQDRTGPGHTVPVSLERLDTIDADWMFLGALGTGASGGVSETAADVTAARKALADARLTPGFDRLEAVRSDRVVPVDGSAWTSAGGILAMSMVLDDIERTMAGGSAG